GMARGDGQEHDSAEGLSPLEEARARIRSRIEPLRPLQLPLTDAYGCVAAENIFSAVDLPEFASSAMDGFALRASDVAEASTNDPTELKVVGHAMIGQRPEATVGMGEAVAIATGAPIPAGADAVVPIENAEPRDDDLVRVFDPVEEGRHIRPRGEDVRAGEILVPIGERLSAGALGHLAHEGDAHPMVRARAHL